MYNLLTRLLLEGFKHLTNSYKYQVMLEVT